MCLERALMMSDGVHLERALMMSDGVCVWNTLIMSDRPLPECVRMGREAF